MFTSHANGSSSEGTCFHLQSPEFKAQLAKVTAAYEAHQAELAKLQAMSEYGTDFRGPVPVKVEVVR